MFGNKYLWKDGPAPAAVNPLIVRTYDDEWSQVFIFPLLKVVCETMDNYEKEGKHEKLGQVSLLAGVKANPH